MGCHKKGLKKNKKPTRYEWVFVVPPVPMLRENQQHMD